MMTRCNAMAVKVARGVAKGAVGKSQGHSMSIEEGVKDIKSWTGVRGCH